MCVHLCARLRLGVTVHPCAAACDCVRVTPSSCAHSCSARRPRTARWLVGHWRVDARRRVTEDARLTERRGRGDCSVCKCQVRCPSVSEGRGISAAGDSGRRASLAPWAEIGSGAQGRTRSSSAAAGFLLTWPPLCCHRARPTDALGQTGPVHRFSSEPRAGLHLRSGVSFQGLLPLGTFAVLRSEWPPRVLHSRKPPQSHGPPPDRSTGPCGVARTSALPAPTTRPRTEAAAAQGAIRALKTRGGNRPARPLAWLLPGVHVAHVSGEPWPASPSPDALDHALHFAGERGLGRLTGAYGAAVVVYGESACAGGTMAPRA